MRIPERVAWRLYLSISQNTTRVRPLSSLSPHHHHHQLDVVDSRRSQEWTKPVAPKDVLFSTPLRHFFAGSSFSNVSTFSYSTKEGKERIAEEDKVSATRVCAERGECSASALRVGGSSGWSKEEVLNWPNAISIGRLLSGPLLAWMITQGMVKPAIVGLVLAGGSDWLDGYVARRQGINSVLGSYLDPLADKVLVGCIAVSMAYSGLLHPALVALIVARDGVLLVGSFVYRAYTLHWKWSGLDEFFKIGAGGVEKVEPLYISKVNMVLQLALVGTALLLPAMETPDTYSIVPILSWSVVATTSMSWIGYAWIYLRKPVPNAVSSGVKHLSQRTSGGSSRKVENSNST